MPLRAIVLLLLLPSQAAAQGQPSRSQVLAAGWDVMQNAGFCSFITLGDDGHPQARTVDPLGPDRDSSIWVATNPRTRKVGQVRRDPRVTLHCFEPATSSYVTILAKASLVTDAAEKARHWKPSWTPFYPGGAAGADAVLIRLTPSRMEVVSESRGLAPDPKTWLPLAATFPQ
jgi:general stress protein 26